MAVVDTESGKVSGLESDGVHVFKGIPYGASTAGANRFMPPAKAAAWTGVRECTAYAGRSPQAAAAAQRPGARDGVGRDRHPAGRRGLPDAARLDARPRQRQAAGDGLAARRRLLLRLGQLAALRQHATRQAQRRGGRRGQPSPQHLRPSRPVGAMASASPQSGNAGVLDLVLALEWVRDARGALRRRSRQRHDLRPVGRRRKGERPARHAAGQGPVPQGHRAERLERALRRARAHDAARRRRAEALRPQAKPGRAAAVPAGRQALRSDRAGAEDAAPAALSPARPLQLRPGDRRQGAARASVRAGDRRSPTTCR